MNYGISSRFGKVPCSSDLFIMLIRIGSNSSLQVLICYANISSVPNNFSVLGCL